MAKVSFQSLGAARSLIPLFSVWTNKRTMLWSPCARLFRRRPSHDRSGLCSRAICWQTTWCSPRTGRRNQRAGSTRQSGLPAKVERTRKRKKMSTTICQQNWNTEFNFFDTEDSFNRWKQKMHRQHRQSQSQSQSFCFEKTNINQN